MAYVLYQSGRRELVPQQKAVVLWRIHSGDLPPTTKEELAYAVRLRQEVKKIVLNWHDAPDAYIRANLGSIIPQALAEWAVTPDGKPLKPASNSAWSFAKKFGLWKAGRPTPLVVSSQLTLV